MTQSQHGCLREGGQVSRITDAQAAPDFIDGGPEVETEQRSRPIRDECRDCLDATAQEAGSATLVLAAFS